MLRRRPDRRPLFGPARRNLRSSPPMATRALMAPAPATRRWSAVPRWHALAHRAAPSVSTRSPTCDGGDGEGMSATECTRWTAVRGRSTASAMALFTPGIRVLARGVDVREHELLVHARQHAAEVLEQGRAVPVAVRLEGHDDATRRPRAGSSQHGRDLRRVVTVVVDDGHARGFAEHLEPTFGPGRNSARARVSCSTGTSSSRPTATAASALSRLCRPGSQ